MPDWSKLHAYADQKWKSFEELCYQIAFRIHASDGQLTRIDDTGGGDGIEFYLTLKNGREIGWQTKFYHPEPRLKNGNRKRHIKESLKRSLASHPKLKKWILCTPTPFNRDEQKWFSHELGKAAGKVYLEHWDGSKIDAMLSKPEVAGIRLNFFGELEFTPEWFCRQVNNQLRNISDKYNPLLHTAGEADLAAHSLLGGKLFVEELTRLAHDYDRYLKEFVAKSEAARRTTFDIRLCQRHTEALRHIDELERLVNQGKKCIPAVETLVLAGRVEGIDRKSIATISGDIVSCKSDFYRAAEALAEEHHRLPVAVGSDSQKTHDAFNSSYSDLSAPVRYCIDDMLDFLQSCSHLVKSYASHSLHFIGGAGVGKTHLTCDLSEQRVTEHLPAILILGRDFSSESVVKTRILEICDIPKSYSFQDFIDALESYALSRQTKVLVAIDGLNESRSPEVWKNQLGELEAALESCLRVTLVTTCRTSYVAAIWVNGKPNNFYALGGFGPGNVEEAVQKYFDHYKLRATLTASSLTILHNPLYLKLFCQSQNPDRADIKTVHIGEQSFLEIFDTFLDEVNTRISQRLSRLPAAKITQDRLLEFGRELWSTNARQMPVGRATVRLDNCSAENINWENSLTSSLEQENLLIMRDWSVGTSTEYVSFTYDLFGGYIIAKALLANLDGDTARHLIRSNDFARRLLTNDDRSVHPLHEDILRCMAVLLPRYFGLYLHSEVSAAKALSVGIEALFEMHPSNIRDVDKRALKALFNTTENRKRLLGLAADTALAVDHPLNWRFWSGLLGSLQIAERDVSWTEVVRGNADSFLALASKVEGECRNTPDFSAKEQERLSLAATYLSWLLVSTDRRVRDFATKALYWYGRRFPQQLFALTLEALKISDPYVPERMLAASYGVAMALHKKEESLTFGREIFRKYSRALFDAMFASRAKHGTTHALIRDYAKHTIDLGLLLVPTLLGDKERKKITPPFRNGGIRRLRQGKDRNAGQYTDGNAPLGMDFHNYTLGRLIPARHNYDYQDPSFKSVESHVWWRIYNLGYSLEKFGAIDKQIAHRSYVYSYNSTRGGRLDRYGKKYAWIAFFELYGLFQDRGTLPINWHESDGRPSDVDIEPSFPESNPPVALIEKSFLEPKSMPAREWVQAGPKPDAKPYLVRAEISGAPGPWVLLDGSLSEEDENCDHRISVHITALIARAGDAARLLRTKRKDITEGFWMPRGPETYYSFVGEMPWCESIPENGWTDLELLMAIRNRLESKRDVTERLKNARSVQIRWSGIKKGAWFQSSGKPSARDLKKPKVIYENVIKKFKVFVPVRYMSWESYHTETAKGHGAMLAKDVAHSLELWVDLPSTDFRDSDGKRATFTCQWGESPYRNHGKFLYIRRDLFDRYLESNGLGCVWGLWGERTYPVKALRAYNDQTDPHPRYTAFNDCWLYPPGQ